MDVIYILWFMIMFFVSINADRLAVNQNMTVMLKQYQTPSSREWMTKHLGEANYLNISTKASTTTAVPGTSLLTTETISSTTTTSTTITTMSPNGGSVNESILFFRQGCGTTLGVQP